MTASQPFIPLSIEAESSIIYCMSHLPVFPNPNQLLTYFSEAVLLAMILSDGRVLLEASKTHSPLVVSM